MKKIFTLTLLVLASCIVFGQNKKSSELEIASLPDPTVEAGPTASSETHYLATPPALWDIQFNYNIGDSTGGNGNAGAIFTGTEYWVSRWASDTIFSFDITGSLTSTFTIPGVSGARSLTWDGTSIYIGNASTTIYEVNPTTKTVTGTITSPEPARHCTYDSTADAGAGGFWVGNWSTDIVLISRTGATLSTIPAATHGMTSMYGSAFDNITAGGPYLWIFDQSTSGSQSDLVRLQLPAGTPTVLVHDVMSDVGLGSTSGLAGGLFITDQIVPGEWTIGGVLQGTPSNLLFGYELDDFVQPEYDANLVSVGLSPGYSQIPTGHESPLDFNGEVTNMGISTITNTEFHSRVDFGGGTVYEDSSSIASLISGGTDYGSNTYTPASGIGTYDVFNFTTVSAPQTDTVPANDTASFSFMVTDSTYARDNGVHNGSTGYAVSSTDWGIALTKYELMVDDTLTSIYINIATPVDGDTTYPVLVSMSGGFPLNVVAQGDPVIISSAQNEYVLTFPGDIPMTAGEWGFGVYEGVGTTINLAQSNDFYEDNINFFYTGASGWAASGIQTARFIRPNFGDVGILLNTSTEDLDDEITLYPNPSSGQVNLKYDLTSSTTLHVTVTDLTGKTMFQKAIQANGSGTSLLDLSQFSNGIYLVKVENDKGTAATIQKLTITK